MADEEAVTFTDLPYDQYSGSLGDQNTTFTVKKGEYTTSDPVELHVLYAMGYVAGSQQTARRAGARRAAKAAAEERAGLEEETGPLTKEDS